MVPPAEDLDVSVISYLIRNDAPYITNRYPIGRLPEFSRDGTLMDMGEEARNNTVKDVIGYGHSLFLNIPHLVQPVSTGMLAAKPNAPDFPTISMALRSSQESRRHHHLVPQWKRHGISRRAGAETVDAYNVGDGSDADYQRYYRFLNCGFKLPASTGTDWWVYDHNRVFVQVEGAFTYDSWLAGLRAGRTFVSNGPLLEFHVNGKGPGSSITASEMVQVHAKATSRLPFDRLQIIQDGEVVAEQTARDGRVAMPSTEIPVTRSGWIAARVAFQTPRPTPGSRSSLTPTRCIVQVAGIPRGAADAAGTRSSKNWKLPCASFVRSIDFPARPTWRWRWAAQNTAILYEYTIKSKIIK